MGRKRLTTEAPCTTIDGVTRDSIDVEIDVLSESAKRLLERDPATRKGILLLVAHVSKMKEKHVKRVFEATAQLARKYVKT